MRFVTVWNLGKKGPVRGLGRGCGRQFSERREGDADRRGSLHRLRRIRLRRKERRGGIHRVGQSRGRLGKCQWQAEIPFRLSRVGDLRRTLLRAGRGLATLVGSRWLSRREVSEESLLLQQIAFFL